jgi:hypothetical protein
MDRAFFAMPIWLSLLLFAMVPAAIAVLLHDQFRRIVPGEKLIPHHEVAGFLVSIVGLLYAVVLAFLVAEAWTTFDNSQRTADSEASSVAEAFVTATLLPQPERSKVRSLLADYAFEVRDREWPLLVEGRQDLKAREYLLAAFKTVLDVRIPSNVLLPEALQLQSAQQIVLGDLHDVSTERRARLLDVGRRVPTALYFALIFGWVILMAFVFLFRTPRALQLTMTGLVAAMVGLLFGLVVQFDVPYSRGIRVSTEAWTFVIENNHLEQYRTTTAP